MGITVVGGGSGTGSASGLAGGATTQQNLFTTPNNTNSMFIVHVTWSSAVSFASGGVGSQSGVSPFVCRVGPNTSVKAVWSLGGSGGSYTITWCYNYVEVQVNT